MPYDIYNNNIMDAWNNQSVMDMVRNQVAAPEGYSGNIDLASRPVVQNPDGTISTVRSKSFGIDGKEVLLPTISPEGKALSDGEAINQYMRTGQHLGMFDNPESATAMAQRIHDQQAKMYGNSVFNQMQRAENPTPVPPPTQPAVQTAVQGMRRRPTAADFEAFALKYLADKGYSLADAQELMAPDIAAYKLQEQADNKAMADSLINDMQGLAVDSDAYRQKAIQLLRLDPQMGAYMLKEGISPRDKYLRGQKLEDMNTALQQRKDMAVFNSGLQWDNFLKRAGFNDERQRKLMADKVNWLVSQGVDPQQAALAVMGSGGRGRNAIAGSNGVTKDDYKRAVDGLKAFVEKIAEKRLEDPSYQLSPAEQQEYNMLYAVKQKGDSEFFARNGVGQQQPQPKQVKYDPNDYYSFGPLLQEMVKMNGGMSKDVARALRYKLGFDPDDNSPNNFVNQVLKEQYGFSG